MTFLRMTDTYRTNYIIHNPNIYISIYIVNWSIRSIQIVNKFNCFQKRNQRQSIWTMTSYEKTWKKIKRRSMNLGEELAGEHSSVLNSTVGRLIRSRNVPTLRSRIRSELQGALRRPITLPLPLVRRSVVIQRTDIDAATI